MARCRLKISNPIGRRMATGFTALALVFLATACVSMSQPALRFDYYTLHYPPPAPITETPLPVILRVDRFSDPAAGTGRWMIWTSDGLQLREYPYRRWQALPGVLVAGFLARDIRESGIFTAVVDPGALVPPTHVLEGSVDQFLEERTEAGWFARLTVTITLVASPPRDAARPVLFQKCYKIRVPEDDHAPGIGLAEAMGRAMAELSARIGHDLRRRLSPAMTGRA